ncbi:nitroreductase [Pseudorhodoferax sp. Leaf274]|uniref:nitroreductase n=1 Tax=Pseudorhodoferax sp. Leaf274 TaxID=1736318 RepID=UPI000703A29E|nr:nitroreductase [Pseudorhodoferax sp. Leaf274]KQP36338.1 nitroreductase [Pseudorhodoferax sp. Leaf274]
MNPTHPAHQSTHLDDLLAQRHSCRQFRPDPVPRATIERMLALAQRSASWCNAQPWQVTVTSGQATERLRQLLLDHAGAPAAPDFPWPRAYQGVYQQRRRECGLALYDSVGIARGDRAASARQAMENFRLFGAPHVALITTDEALGLYGAVDCGAYVANFLLAATSLGVATIAQAALAARGPLVRTHFGLPDSRRLVCGISFGFADAEHPANRFRTIRAPLADAVQWAD